MSNTQTRQKHLAAVSQLYMDRVFPINFNDYFPESINNTNLMSCFGVRKVATYCSLSLYKKLPSKNIEYDTEAKIYAEADNFKSLLKYHGSQAISLLCHVATSIFFGAYRLLLSDC